VQRKISHCTGSFNRGSWPSGRRSHSSGTGVPAREKVKNAARASWLAPPIFPLSYPSGTRVPCPRLVFELDTK